MLKKDDAVCIRALDYSETSQIVSFFTREHGKVSAIAKGSKRSRSPFDGPIEIFSNGRIVFSDKNRESLATLTEFEQVPGFVQLLHNLFALNCSLFAAELISSMTDEYDPHPTLFDKFLQFLNDIGRQTDQCLDEGRTLGLLIAFKLALLKEVGLQPVLDACANCKKPFGSSWCEYYFSSSANGLICRDCENGFPDKIKLSETIVRAMNSSATGNPDALAELKIESVRRIEKVLVHHFTEIMNRPPKMARHVLRN